MEQTKKTLVLCIPRMDGPPIKREEAGASQMENPPAPQAEGEDLGAGEAQEPQPDSGNGSMDELGVKPPFDPGTYNVQKIS